jgi:diketogulonate reductase-like aldo/keto reductase
MVMEKRRAGTTCLDVSRIGLGCVTFGREIDEAVSFQVLDHALDQGINLFDTAEAYGGGQAREYRQKSLGVDDVMLPRLSMPACSVYRPTTWTSTCSTATMPRRRWRKHWRL